MLAETHFCAKLVINEHLAQVFQEVCEILVLLIFLVLKLSLFIFEHAQREWQLMVTLKAPN